MPTPTDPYNSARSEHSDGEAVLTEITDVTRPETEDAASVAYGDGDALAWESAFAAEEKSASPEPEDHHDPLGDLTFDEIPAAHSDNAAAVENPLDEDPSQAVRSSADADQERDVDANGDTSSAADTSTRTGRHLSDAQPLEAGATFASAYSATGVTQLPEPPVVAAAEHNAGADDSTIAPTPAEGPVRESVLPAGTADDITAVTSQTSQWSRDPGAPQLADIPEQPKSRIGAHIGSIFATLVLIPICWYLISDAGVRLNLVENNPWETGTVNIGALLEMAGGFIALFVLWLMARASTLGAQIWGILLTLAGLVAIVAPSLGTQVSTVVHNALWDVNSFTRNVAHHFDLDLGSGRIAIFGFLLFLTGLMIHLARKSAARRAEALALREHILGSDQN
ncbi:MAG: hypothetical protein PT944_06820 [Actinomycetaceae bacterium]|nr:hypothetical protein [Arcanobacterium sp.]MDD7687604.1 hypothetical protein [Actinomycetaceae bacterium]MDY5273158.1 hypothetical protein [Arcanobacterium sp.]